MKKYYYKDFVITKLNNYLKQCYNCNYLITINHDIFDFTNNLKNSKKIIDNYYKELEN